MAKNQLNGLLSLVATGSHYGRKWPADDYVVLFDEEVIDRIHSQARQKRPWFWIITTPDQSASLYNRGYSPTREQAMADFKARFLQHQISDTETMLRVDASS